MDAPSTFYSYDDLVQLTGKKRHSTQRAELNKLGIVHKVRSDGSLLVLRSHVEQLLGGNATPAKKPEPVPNWDAMYAPRPRR